MYIYQVATQFFCFCLHFFSSAVTRLLIKKYFFFSNFNIDFISYITMIFFIFKNTYCKFAHTKKYCKHLYQLSPYHATDLHVRSSIRTKGRDNV